MKNKKIALLSIFFLAGFFIFGFGKLAKADCSSAYDVCTDTADSDVELSACLDNLQVCEDSANDSAGSGNTTPPDNYQNLPGYKTDCSDYLHTHAVEGKCECDTGYDIRNADGSCSKSGAEAGQGTTQADCDLFGEGYVVNSTKDGCVKNRGGTGAGTESCDADPSCWFYNCCDTSSNTTGSGSDVYSMATIPSATTVHTSDGRTIQIPAGAQIMNDGSVYNNGSKIAPSGSVEVPTSNTINGLSLCANGALHPIGDCGSGGGVLLVATLGGGGGGGGGAPTQKCGTNFTEVGGVCFPTNTGLSAAPIEVIVSNIFTWLMGLFVTLAVIAFVISGIQYFLSAGDEDLAKSAKKNATNAVIGIIIGLSGFVIIKAIVMALAGTTYLF